MKERGKKTAKLTLSRNALACFVFSMGSRGGGYHFPAKLIVYLRQTAVPFPFLMTTTVTKNNGLLNAQLFPKL